MGKCLFVDQSRNFLFFGGRHLYFLLLWHLIVYKGIHQVRVYYKIYLVGVFLVDFLEDWMGFIDFLCFLDSWFLVFVYFLFLCGRKNRPQYNISKMQLLRSHPRVLVAEEDFVKASFFCNKRYFDHFCRTFHYLHGKDWFHFVNGVIDFFIFLTFIFNLKHTFIINTLKKPKLYIISVCLEHNRNYRIRHLNFNNILQLAASGDVVELWDSNV